MSFKILKLPMSSVASYGTIILSFELLDANKPNALILSFAEVILYSFFIIWFGIAFLVVAIIEFFFPLPSIWVQLSLVK
jgi:hypothetical protein